MLNTIYFLIILLLLSILAWPHLAPAGASRREVVSSAVCRQGVVEAPELSRLDAIYRRRAATLSEDFETTRSNVGTAFRHPLESSPEGDR